MLEYKEDEHHEDESLESDTDFENLVKILDQFISLFHDL